MSKKKVAQFIGFFVLALCFGFEAQAQNALKNDNRSDKTLTLAIPQQDLSGALRELSLVANFQLVSLSSLFEGKTSNAVEGSYTLDEALTKMLEGTSLSYEFISEKILLITQQKESPQVIAEVPKRIIEEPKVIQETEVVTVTGSRIPRSEFDLPYPTQAIDPAYLERGSYTTVGDALNSLPLMCESIYSLNASGNAGNLGEAYGDLYCLGTQRTLTLINGRRTISSNDPSVLNPEPGLQVDLNMIPRIMMKSIEVIGVGSAPVYGSDAVAGTINILLKDDFDGFDMSFEHGISDLQDARQDNLSLLFGRNFSDVEGNITFAYEYHRQRQVNALDRRYTQFDRDYVRVGVDPNDPLARDYLFAEDVVNPLVTTGGIPTPRNGLPLFALGENAFFTPDFEPLVFSDNQFLRVFDRGQLTAELDRRVGGDGVREQFYRTLRVPIERHVANVSSRFEIFDDIEIFSEVQFYRNRSESISDTGDVVPTFANSGLPQPDNLLLTAGVGFNSEFTSLPIAADNPFLLNEQRELLALLGVSRDIFFLHKDWRGVISPRASGKSDIVRGVVGARGDMTLGAQSWNWELSLNKGVSSSEVVRQRVNAPNFTRALSAARAENGEIVCLDDTENCSPFNPFGVNPSPAAIDYITQAARDKGRIEQEVLTASIRGAIAELPAGPLAVALGVEQRRENAEYRPADIIEPRSSEIDEGIIGAFENEFDTQELFFEVIAPVVGENILPWLTKMELETNWRGIDNSNAGTDTTWSAGARFIFDSDTASLVLRGNLGRSVRAPSLFEFFRPFTPVTTELNDPCDAGNVGRGTNPVNRERTCVEQAALSALVYNSNEFSALIPDAGPLRLGGTPDLRNEKAKSYTLGVVFDSNALELLRFSVDLIDIEVEEAIIERDLERMVVQCYDRRLLDVCTDFIRDSRTFQLFAISNAYENIGLISLSAIQYNLLYGFNFGEESWLPGDFTLDMSAYNLREFVERDRLARDNRLGSLDYPEWRLAANLAYTLQNIELSLSSQYTSETSVELPFESSAQKAPEVESYWLHHLSMRVDLNSFLSARLGVRNVLDTGPPKGLPSSEVGSAYDALGRYYSFGVSLSF